MVRYCLQGHIFGLLYCSQHVEAGTPIHDSDMADISLDHWPFFFTIQKVELIAQLYNRLYSSDKNEATAVIDAMKAARILELKSMPWAKVKRTDCTFSIWAVLTQLCMPF